MIDAPQDTASPLFLRQVRGMDPLFTLVWQVHGISRPLAVMSEDLALDLLRAEPRLFVKGGTLTVGLDIMPIPELRVQRRHDRAEDDPAAWRVFLGDRLLLSRDGFEITTDPGPDRSVWSPRDTVIYALSLHTNARFEPGEPDFETLRKERDREALSRMTRMEEAIRFSAQEARRRYEAGEDLGPVVADFSENPTPLYLEHDQFSNRVLLMRQHDPEGHFDQPMFDMPLMLGLAICGPHTGLVFRPTAPKVTQEISPLSIEIHRNPKADASPWVVRLGPDLEMPISDEDARSLVCHTGALTVYS